MPQPFTFWTRSVSKRLHKDGVPFSANCLFFEMLTFWNPKAEGLIFPSRHTLAEVSGQDIRSVRRGLKALEGAGYLQRSGTTPSGVVIWALTTKAKDLVHVG